MADGTKTGIFGFVVQNMGLIELVGVFGLVIIFGVREILKTSKTLAETEADPSKVKKVMLDEPSESN